VCISVGVQSVLKATVSIFIEIANLTDIERMRAKRAKIEPKKKMFLSFFDFGAFL
jgi:hypothetical protein